MADVTVGGPDKGLFAPLAERTVAELERAGANPPALLLAYAGFWNGPQIAALREAGDRRARRARPPGAARPACESAPHSGAARSRAARPSRHRRRPRRLPQARADHRADRGQTKANRGFDRFLCRGLGACRAEWSLITATHNLLKAWRHGLAATAA